MWGAIHPDARAYRSDAQNFHFPRYRRTFITKPTRAVLRFIRNAVANRSANRGHLPEIEAEV